MTSAEREQLDQLLIKITQSCITHRYTDGGIKPIDPAIRGLDVYPKTKFWEEWVPMHGKSTKCKKSHRFFALLEVWNGHEFVCFAYSRKDHPERAVIDLLQGCLMDLPSVMTDKSVANLPKRFRKKVGKLLLQYVDLMKQQGVEL